MACLPQRLGHKVLVPGTALTECWKAKMTFSKGLGTQEKISAGSSFYSHLIVFVEIRNAKYINRFLCFNSCRERAVPVSSTQGWVCSQCRLLDSIRSACFLQFCLNRISKHSYWKKNACFEKVRVSSLLLQMMWLCWYHPPTLSTGGLGFAAEVYCNSM